MKYKFDIEAIVATDLQNGFAKDNDIPWNIPLDMKHFRKITTKVSDSHLKNVVIMGRKTYEHMGKLLPNRINIILTKTGNIQVNHCDTEEGYLCASYEEALYLCETLDNIDKVFIIGGKNVYQNIIYYNHVSVIHKTVVHDDFKCDTFFPDITEKYKREHITDYLQQNNYTFHFETWKLQ